MTAASAIDFGSWNGQTAEFRRCLVQDCGRVWQALAVHSNGLDEIIFQDHDKSDTVKILDQLIAIWAQNNPDKDPVSRKQVALQHVGGRGFRCSTASTGSAIVGYAYGLYHTPGMRLVLDPTGTKATSFVGSHDLIIDQETKKLPPGGQSEIHNPWLAAYDIGEVQVLAGYRGLGIGETLVRRLCRSLPADDRVVLIVEPDNGVARRVYERIGFKNLYDNPVTTFFPPHVPQIVMGLERAGDA